MPKKVTKNTVQPHTEAKLQFFMRYLERYLRILFLATGVQKINIYDMFCGAGIYSDGKTGSAIRAVDAVWEAQTYNNRSTAVNLHLNDLDMAKIKNLRTILESRSSAEKKFSISYSQFDASKLLKDLPAGFAKQDSNTRNLVFIDPYGYKTIDCQALETLAKEGKTEVMLFLPIEQMYRFARKAVEADIDKSLDPLQKFIEQLQIDVSAISSERDYISAIEKALSFAGATYSTSYPIKNHTGHYYALFFVTSNLYGLEKILEVKWELDPQEGGEFAGSQQSDFFLEFDKQTQLAIVLRDFLEKRERSNLELYEFVLRAGFMPKHANRILRQWQAEEQVYVEDIAKRKPARKNGFKLTYKEYRRGNITLMYKIRGGRVS